MTCAFFQNNFRAACRETRWLLTVFNKIFPTFFFSLFILVSLYHLNVVISLPKCVLWLPATKISLLKELMNLTPLSISHQFKAKNKQTLKLLPLRMNPPPISMNFSCEMNLCFWAIVNIVKKKRFNRILLVCITSFLLIFCVGGLSVDWEFPF